MSSTLRSPPSLSLSRLLPVAELLVIRARAPRLNQRRDVVEHAISTLRHVLLHATAHLLQLGFARPWRTWLRSNLAVRNEVTRGALCARKLVDKVQLAVNALGVVRAHVAADLSREAAILK